MPTLETLPERIAAKITVDATGCWLWTGYKIRGYGQVHFDKRKHLAHRLMYQLVVGPIPAGYQVDHLCRTPSCVDGRSGGMTYEKPERGPVQRYEVVWMSGHVETVLAHQVSYPQRGAYLTRGMFGSTDETPGRPKIEMHAELNGHWLLTLSALEEDIRTVRLITEDEPIPGTLGEATS